MFHKYDADAWITQGTAKILVDLLNGEHRSPIAQLTLESFEGLGIRILNNAKTSWLWQFSRTYDRNSKNG